MNLETLKLTFRMTPLTTGWHLVRMRDKGRKWAWGAPVDVPDTKPPPDPGNRVHVTQDDVIRQSVRAARLRTSGSVVKNAGQEEEKGRV